MKKIIKLLSLGIASLTVFSCVNPDPLAVYGPNYQDIPGPRYLYKVEANGLLYEEYTATSGKITRMDRYNYNGTVQEEHHKIDLTYSGNRIAQMDFTGSQTGNPTVVKYKYVPTYDAAGRIVSYVKDGLTGTVITTHSLGEVNYDTTGRVTKIFEKTATVTTPNVYNYTTSHESNLLYNGESDVIKNSYITKMYDGTTGIVMSTMTDVYEYPTYDSKVNPYSSLPKDFRTLFAALDPTSTFHLSANNPMKLKFYNSFLPAAVETSYVYQYDQQGFAVHNGYTNFLYKPLQ